MNKKNTKNGFTLIEIMMVVAVIGIFTAVIIMRGQEARVRGRDARRLGTMEKLYTAIILYHGDNGSFPESIAYTEMSPYLPDIPTQGYRDPLTNKLYNYGTNGDGSDPAKRTKYQLWIEMERHVPAMDVDSDLDASGYNVEGTGLKGIDARVPPAGPTDTEACTSATNDCIYDIGIE